MILHNIGFESPCRKAFSLIILSLRYFIFIRYLVLVFFFIKVLIFIYLLIFVDSFNLLSRYDG